jgi:hypothetical protein
MSGIPNAKKFTQANAQEMGAKGGTNKKGSKHLSTLIREIGENIDWDKTTLKNKEQLKQLYGNNGWRAIVYVAMTKAMAGDTKAMDWLAKNGYGSHVDLTSNGETIKGAIIEFVADPNEL